jgi:5'-3' exonuclease
VTNEAAFQSLRGFGVRSMPDFLALTGDTADGIPGLAGFGERSAAMLLGAYDHLEHIPRHPFQWKVKPRGALALAATLAERREEVLLYRQLATLVDTAPVSDSLDELRFAGVPRPRFEAWCDQMGVTTMRTTPRRWADG